MLQKRLSHSAIHEHLRTRILIAFPAFLGENFSSISMTKMPIMCDRRKGSFRAAHDDGSFVYQCPGGLIPRTTGTRSEIEPIIPLQFCSSQPRLFAASDPIEHSIMKTCRDPARCRPVTRDGESPMHPGAWLSSLTNRDRTNSGAQI